MKFKYKEIIDIAKHHLGSHEFVYVIDCRCNCCNCHRYDSDKYSYDVQLGLKCDGEDYCDNKYVYVVMKKEFKDVFGDFYITYTEAEEEANKKNERR